MNLQVLKINRHDIVIQSNLARVATEIVRWGESSWWPERCQMRFTRLSLPEAVRVGTKYQQQVLIPLVGPRWDCEVTRLIPGELIERTFLSGVLSGHETVRVDANSKGGAQVDYTMHYRIRGGLNRLGWKLIFERLHDQNIRMILNALKNFCEGT